LSLALGCEGWVIQNDEVDLIKFLDLPGLDIPGKSVFNTKIHIFGGQIPIFAKLTDLLKESFESKVPLVVKEVSPTDNLLDEAITSPTSVFRIMSNIYTVGSFMCIIETINVIIKFYRAQGNRIPLRSYCSISLALVLMANIMRFAKSIDVLGVRS
jgi:hypothetical protein